MATEHIPENSVAHPGAGEPIPARRKAYLNWKVGCALVAGVVAIFLWRVGVGRAHANIPPSRPTPVAVIHPALGDLSEEVVCDAELRPYQEIDLHAKVAGYLERIDVDIGDRVTAGQQIAIIEVPELQDDLRRATAAVKRSEEQAERDQAAWDEADEFYSRLSGVGKAQPSLIAQQELDAAKEKDRAAASALAAAKADVDVSRAELKKLETILKYSQITAPFAGVITRRYADPGALIQAGTSGQSSPIVRLSQVERLRLDIPVSVAHVAFIEVGAPVEVRIQSLGTTLSGKIARFTRSVDTATRTMEAEMDVPNADLKLIPGMYAAAVLRLNHRDKVLTLPVEAISRDKSSSVFIVDGHNCIENRAIALGLETPHRIEVLSGLTETNLVLIGNKSLLKPGQQVLPKLMTPVEGAE